MRLPFGKPWLRSLSLCFLLSANIQAANPDRALSLKIAKDIENGQIVYYDDTPETVTYYRNGAYDPKGLARINELLRDRHDGATPAHGMDAHLIDMLYELKAKIKEKHPDFNGVLSFICGYRSPQTNEHLRTDKNYPYRDFVAQGSEHTYAMAVDVFAPGMDRDTLRDAAWCVGKRSGGAGVGTYPKIQFPEGYIHLDSRKRLAFWGTQPTGKCEKEFGAHIAMR